MAKIELNYYPITLDSSTKEGTADTPQANMPNVSDTGTIKESGGSAKVPQNSLQSSNYINGVAGWAIKADGFAEFDDLHVRDNAYIGDKDSTHIHLDGTNTRMRSSNYVAGVAGAGFSIEPSFAEFGDIRARGVIRSAVFQKNVISSIGGSFAVIDSDALATDMTAADSSTLKIDGNTTFAVGDFLRIKDGIDDEWLEVTDIGSAPTYTVTRDKASVYAADTNPAWTKGATVVNYRQSGDGLIYMTASDTNAPYLEVQTHAGSPWSALTARLRLGNLNGFLDYASDLYGIAIGETNKYLKYDPTNGLEIRGQSSVSSVFTAGEAISAGEAVAIGDGSAYQITQATQDSSYSPTGTTWYAQTFLAKATSISSVIIYARNNNALEGTLRLSIRATSAGLPTGADLDYVDVTLGNDPTPAERTFTFSSPVTVTPGATYAFCMRNVAGENWIVYTITSSAYANGNSVTSTDSGSSWSADTRDFYFKINTVSSVAGSVYKASASSEVSTIFSSNFLGIAEEAISNGSTGPIIISGVDSTQSSLTVGVPYYLSNTAGAIATSAGDVSKKIGLSTSATSLLILNS